jgi:hypothetical protein
VSNKATNEAIVRWEVCYGDNDRIFYKTDNTEADEKELIRRLLFHLSLCRKNKIPIITFGTNELPIVRTRILFSDIRGVNLRYLKTISIRKILEDYFCIGTNNTMSTPSDFAREMGFESNNATDTELLRDIFLRIRSLLPTEAIL